MKTVSAVPELSCKNNILKFSTTWVGVSLPRSTTSSGWKLLLFVEFETKYLQIFTFKQAISFPITVICPQLINWLKTTIVMISRQRVKGLIKPLMSDQSCRRNNYFIIIFFLTATCHVSRDPALKKQIQINWILNWILFISLENNKHV